MTIYICKKENIDQELGVNICLLVNVPLNFGNMASNWQDLVGGSYCRREKKQSDLLYILYMFPSTSSTNALNGANTEPYPAAM